VSAFDLDTYLGHRRKLVDEALDRTLRICRAAAREDEAVALVFAQLGERRARAGLAALLQRRIVAPQVLASYLASGPADLDAATVSRRAAASLIEVFESMRGGFERFMQTGPLEPGFLLLARSLRRLRDARLPFETLTVYSTPRRLAVLVRGLIGRQASQRTTVTGPPKKAAFDAAGQPTKAAEGFARSQGVSVAELTTITMKRSHTCGRTRSPVGLPSSWVFVAFGVMRNRTKSAAR
jgi:hypothetical protein